MRVAAAKALALVTAPLFLAWNKLRQSGCPHDWTSIDDDGNPLGYDMAYGAVLYRCRHGCGAERWL